MSYGVFVSLPQCENKRPSQYFQLDSGYQRRLQLHHSISAPKESDSASTSLNRREFANVSPCNMARTSAIVADGTCDTRVVEAAIKLPYKFLNTAVAAT
jgi:hypothetical protein